MRLGVRPAGASVRAMQLPLSSRRSGKDHLPRDNCGIACIAVVALGGLFLLAWTMRSHVVSTRAYRQAVDIVESSPDVRKVLGDDVRVHSPVLGLALTGYGSKFVEWGVAFVWFAGQSSSLYGVANEVRGTWEFSRLTMISDTGGEKIELAPKPVKLSLPPVPVKKVYLVPFGLEANDSLDWAPAYYEAKLGIEVSVLPQ
jgi:hypothetical protein